MIGFEAKRCACGEVWRSIVVWVLCRGMEPGRYLWPRAGRAPSAELGAELGRQPIHGWMPELTPNHKPWFVALWSVYIPGRCDTGASSEQRSGSLAHLAERRTFNPRAAGSRPAGIKRSRAFGAMV